MDGNHGDMKLSRRPASTEPRSLTDTRSDDLLYTPIETRFERITRLAARALDVPVAAITLLNADKQWFKSVVGWDVSELSAANSYCARVAADARICIVPDTSTDQRFADHPLTVGHPNYRFYASHPLYDESMRLIGTFCVFDTRSRELSDVECETFNDAGQLAQRELATSRSLDLQAELSAELGAARREAVFDPLTRVWNRRGATVLLNSAVRRVRENGQDLGVCLLDLDKLKKINDRYGHQMGDHVLRKVAGALVNCLRPSDVVCRYGGDEFLLLLPGADSIQSSTIAERARRSIADTVIQTRDGALSVSISVGYAVCQQGADVELSELMSRIDRALLESKRDGRNLVRLAG